MPHFDEQIEILANLAEPEDWDYHHTASTEPKPILRNYVKYSYRRIAHEKKIAVTLDEKHACWNSGLVTFPTRSLSTSSSRKINSRIGNPTGTPGSLHGRASGN